MTTRPTKQHAPWLLGGLVVFGVALSLLYLVFHPVDHRYLSEAGYDGQYNHGLYRYRQLSRQLLFALHALLSLALPPGELGAVVETPHRNPFWLSVYAINLSSGLATVSGCWYWLFRTDDFRCTERRRKLVYALMVVAITVGCFWLNGYDGLSYLFFVTTAFFTLRWVRAPLRVGELVALAALIGVGALNRETPALNLALMLAVAWWRFERVSTTLLAVALPTLAYLLVYVGLRVRYGVEHGVYESSQLIDNLTHVPDLLGWSLWFIGSWVAWRMSQTDANRRMVVRFLVASLPYWAICMFAAMLHELRLYAPLFLGSLVLAHASGRGRGDLEG